MRCASLLIALVFIGSGQQRPPLDKLPPTARVTDKARPDFGYMRPWAGSEVTVVVVYSVDCPACGSSVPFYKRLATAPGIDGKTGRFVVLTQGGVMPVTSEIEGHPEGFRLGTVAAYPADDRFGVREFPTLLIFDGRWKRRGEWRGRLTPQQEAAALATVKTILGESKGGRR